MSYKMRSKVKKARERKRARRARSEKRRLGPCGRCGLCDWARFTGWNERIRAGLGLEIKDGDNGPVSPRFTLIQEIHEDMGRRYPLGIALRLSDVIKALWLHDDDCAETDLADLMWDEAESFRLNRGDDDHGNCQASVKAFEAVLAREAREEATGGQEGR